MDLAMIKDWLIPVSTFITLTTASISGYLALKEYRLKAQAETRLTKSAQIKSDIKLIQIFIEIMDIAHARRSSQISDKAIEAVISSEAIKKLDLSSKKSWRYFKVHYIMQLLPCLLEAQHKMLRSVLYML